MKVPAPRCLPALLFLSLAVGAGSASAQNGFPVGTAFTAVSLGDATFGAPAPTLTVHEAEGRSAVSGFGGCNRWRAPVEIGPGQRFQIDRILVTRMACKQGSAMQTEAQFLAALRQATRWRLEGEILILEGPGSALRLEQGG